MHWETGHARQPFLRHPPSPTRPANLLNHPQYPEVMPPAYTAASGGFAQPFCILHSALAQGWLEGRMKVACRWLWGRIGVALGWLWGAYPLAIRWLWGGFDVALAGLRHLPPLFLLSTFCSLLSLRPAILHSPLCIRFRPT